MTSVSKPSVVVIGGTGGIGFAIAKFYADRGSKVVITGRDAEKALDAAHITVNKNAIPNDPEKPMVTSGVRIGTPAMTTRGFKDEEARATAHLIADVLEHPNDEAHIAKVREKVHALTSRFPVYQ